MWRSRSMYPFARSPEQRLEQLESWWTCPEHAGLKEALRVFPFALESQTIPLPMPNVSD